MYQTFAKHLFILLSFLGGIKAHGFIKVVILGAMGLAGLWMVHNLAQDYNRVQGGRPKLFDKRSIKNYKNINWEGILARDPAGCARSFICQLAAQNNNNLDKISSNILTLSRLATEEDSWASKELTEALKHGEAAKSPIQCRKFYKFCPYSSQMMTSLLKVFGS